MTNILLAQYTYTTTLNHVAIFPFLLTVVGAV